MDLDVTLIKDGQIVGQERLTNPSEGEVANAIGRLTGAQRLRAGKAIWPAMIDVREPDA